MRKDGFDGIRVGVVRGDDVREAVLERNVALPELGCRVADVESKLVSANTYIGAEPIAELLAADCRIVLGGRIADPSVYVGPICHELGWSLDDWDRVGTATLVAHLLECGIGRGDRTDPLSEPGYPMATISDDGQIEITKLPGTDGRIDTKAVKLHLGYEVHDPAAYLTPDVAVDFTQVWARELARGSRRCRRSARPAAPRYPQGAGGPRPRMEGRRRGLLRGPGLRGASQDRGASNAPSP